MFFVYVLRSMKDGHFYVGLTSDLNLRIERHQKGGVTSTKNRRPLILLHSEEFRTRIEARRREIFLKSGAGHKFLEALQLKKK